MTTWYWYFTGMFTVLFVQSILLNIGLATGFIKWHKRRPQLTSVRLYDQDNSGQYKRPA